MDHSSTLTDKLERVPQITSDRAKDSHKIFERHTYDSLYTPLSRNNLAAVWIGWFLKKAFN